MDGNSYARRLLSGIVTPVMHNNGDFAPIIEE